MAHAVADDPKAHMGLPLPNGKLAMWLFLVTEIMFFTALIGTYLLLRQSSGEMTVPQVHHGESAGSAPAVGEPGRYEYVKKGWPKPEDVHLEEWAGAVNTFVLICSSLTVVLAHYYIARGEIKRATLLVAVTFLLGCVFMAIKAYEYNAKFGHDI